MANAVTAASFVTTLVAVASPEAVADTARVLADVRARAAVRTIFITLGDQHEPAVRREQNDIAIDGLVAKYLNNAVAALRLSSLPSLAWWRGGDAATGRQVLPDLAGLVDRLLLDSPDGVADWTAALPLCEQTQLADVRWARLTRWRSLLAQFFDMPEVRAAAASFDRLDVRGGDPLAAQLLGAWLTTRLGRPVEVAANEEGGGDIDSVVLRGGSNGLELSRLAGGTCISATHRGPSGPVTTRVVSAGDTGTAALLLQELRIRARDAAFERAIEEVISRERR